MKSLLCLAAATLTLGAALPAAAGPSSCRAQAVAVLKQTAAWRHGSVREKQALLRSARLNTLVAGCSTEKSW